MLSLEFTMARPEIHRVPSQFNAGLTDSDGDAISNAAADITVSDTGGYYTATDAEDVLQEVGASLDTLAVVKTMLPAGAGGASPQTVAVQYQEDGVDAASQVRFQVFTTQTNNTLTAGGSKIAPESTALGFGIYETAADGSGSVIVAQTAPGASNDDILIAVLGEDGLATHTIAFTM